MFIKDIANYPTDNGFYADDELGDINGMLIFNKAVEGYFGAEYWLYSTDGTSDGTVLIDQHNYSYDEQGETFHSFAALCDSVFLIVVNADSQYPSAIHLPLLWSRIVRP